jgi:hypothetical protein
LPLTSSYGAYYYRAYRCYAPKWIQKYPSTIKGPRLLRAPALVMLGSWVSFLALANRAWVPVLRILPTRIRSRSIIRYINPGLFQSTRRVRMRLNGTTCSCQRRSSRHRQHEQRHQHNTYPSLHRFTSFSRFRSLCCSLLLEKVPRRRLLRSCFCARQHSDVPYQGSEPALGGQHRR